MSQALKQILIESKKLLRTSSSDSMDEELFLDQPTYAFAVLGPELHSYALQPRRTFAISADPQTEAMPDPACLRWTYDEANHSDG